MLIALATIFILLLFLVFVEKFLGKYKWLMYIVIGIAMIACAGLRPVGFDRDSPNYEMVFLNPDSSALSLAVEPLFIVLSKLLYVIYPDVQILLLTFALVGVTIKFVAIRQLSPLFFLPLIIYFCNFYLLHEMTQIRAGIASSLFLLTIKPLASGKKLAPLLIILLASTFHLSALSLLPLLFLNNKPIKPVWKIVMACLVPACFLLYFLDLDLLTAIPIPYISERIELYKAHSEFGDVDKESILNPFPLMKMAVFLYFLYFADTIKHYVPSINLIIKILGCSLLVYFAFASIKIISTRLSELYGIVEIVAYPCILFTIRPKIVGIILVCIMAFIEIFFNLYMWEIFNF